MNGKKVNIKSSFSLPVKNKKTIMLFVFFVFFLQVAGVEGTIKVSTTRDAMISEMQHLPHNYSVTGIGGAMRYYSEKELANMPITFFLRGENEEMRIKLAQEIFEEALTGSAENGSLLNKDGDLLGWHMMWLIGFGNIHEFCAREDEKVRQEERSRESIKVEREKLKQNIELVKLKQEEKKIKELEAQNFVKKAEVGEKIFKKLSLWVILILSISAVIFGFFFPLFKFLVPKARVKTIKFTNSKSLFIVGARKIGPLSRGFYNEREGKILAREMRWVKDWARNEEQEYQHIILFGEAGVGKSLFAQRIARDSGAFYYYTSGGFLRQLQKKGGGEATKELLAILGRAEKKAKAIVIIDEADSVAFEDLKQIQSFIDKGKSKNLIIILITNHIEKFPKATLSRFIKIKIDLPNEETLEKIVNYYLKKEITTKKMVNKITKAGKRAIIEYAKNIGATGRNLETAINQAGYWAIKERKRKLTKDLVLQKLALSFVEESPHNISPKPTEHAQQTSFRGN